VTLMPQGERVRQAVRWVSDHLREDPGRSRGALVRAAVLRFDLNPKEETELIAFYRDAPPGTPE
jgi:hypothetical protein